MPCAMVMFSRFEVCLPKELYRNKSGFEAVHIHNSGCQFRSTIDRTFNEPSTVVPQCFHRWQCFHRSCCFYLSNLFYPSFPNRFSFNCCHNLTLPKSRTCFRLESSPASGIALKHPSEIGIQQLRPSHLCTNPPCRLFSSRRSLTIWSNRLVDQSISGSCGAGSRNIKNMERQSLQWLKRICIRKAE